MNTLLINESEANEFVSCWSATLEKNLRVNPYRTEREALWFSFDGQMRPFLGHSNGWHIPPKERQYFDRRPAILNELQELMLPYRGTGGRVFIDNRCAYYVDELSKRTNLCKLVWPQGRHIVDEIRRYWKVLHPASSIKLEKVFYAPR